MSEYTVNHNYSAHRDGQRYGPWEKGETVNLDPADAEWVERDSPGCLSAKSERQAKPAADRQHRGGANRSA